MADAAEKQALDIGLIPACSQESESEQSRMMRRIVQGIVRYDLSERQRQVMQLYYYEHKSMREIAAILGVTISSVSHTHRRACRMVREKLVAYQMTR